MATETIYRTVQCRCGHREEKIECEKAAQVAADVHVVMSIRRAYLHNVTIIREDGSARARRALKGSNHLLGRF